MRLTATLILICFLTGVSQDSSSIADTAKVDSSSADTASAILSDTAISFLDTAILPEDEPEAVVVPQLSTDENGAAAEKVTREKTEDGLPSLGKKNIFSRFWKNSVKPASKKTHSHKIDRIIRIIRKLGFLLIIVAALVCAVFFIILKIRKAGEKGRFMTTTRLSIMNKEVQRACRYIEKNYDDSSLNVQSLCETLITGEAFLEALFERELGMRVEDFIDQVRVNRAREMFRSNPDIEIDELVEINGYADKTAFFAAFKKVSGISFNEFRLSVLDAGQNGK